MNLRQRPRWTFVLWLGLLSACATHEQQSRHPAAPVATSVPQASSFEAEWTRAAAGSSPGSAGQTWERSVDQTVVRAYGAVLNDCATQRSSGDPGATSDQRVVLDVALSGDVRHVWSESDSPLLTCVRASLGRTRFPPPPTDGYRFGMRFDLGVPGLPPLQPRILRPAPGSISFDEAMQLALADMGSQEGQLYVHSSSSTFLEVFRTDLGKCMTIPLLEAERSRRRYGLLIEIAADGATSRVLVKPDPDTPASGQFRSPRADCLRDGLGHASFAAPPWDGFWMYVGLDNPPPALPKGRGSD